MDTNASVMCSVCLIHYGCLNIPSSLYLERILLLRGCVSILFVSTALGRSVKRFEKDGREEGICETFSECTFLSRV